MILYRPFDLLWLDADVPLGGAGTAMLQKPLRQGNIEAIGIIDFSCIFVWLPAAPGTGFIADCCLIRVLFAVTAEKQCV